jgi:selenide,water dikinase
VLQPLRDTFRAVDYPDLLVGLDSADDAAVYKLNAEQAIVSTTDFFPPIVDDPYDFGSIAAANALSDVYAMGGKPLFALNLVAFPEGMDLGYLQEILRGGAEKIAEAGAVVAGGHSINDKEPKYGLAVTGVVDPKSLLTKSGSRPGDILILTKKLGTGVITTALKRQLAKAGDIVSATASMKTLNNGAAAAARAAGAQSVTDITGFGLLGHAHEMAHLGHVRFRIFANSLQWLPGAVEYGESGAFPGGMGNNKHFFGPWTSSDSAVPELIGDLILTPETSGGLLMAVTAEKVNIVQNLCPEAYVVGEVVPGDGQIEIVP